MKNPNCKWSK